LKGNKRAVPFNRYKFWLPGFLVFCALNFISFRTLDNAPKFYNQVLSAATGRPATIEPRNAFEACQYIHYFCLCGLAGIFLFYGIDVICKWDVVQEHNADEHPRARQLIWAWVLPLAAAGVSFFWGFIAVYSTGSDGIKWVIGNTQIQTPEGLSEMLIAGPVISSFIIFYAAFFSVVGGCSCCQHVLPIGRTATVVIGFGAIVLSIGCFLTTLLFVDELVVASNTQARVSILKPMNLISCWGMNLVALLLIIIDDIAQPLPLTTFSDDSGVHDEFQKRHTAAHQYDESFAAAPNDKRGPSTLLI